MTPKTIPSRPVNLCPIHAEAGEALDRALSALAVLQRADPFVARAFLAAAFGGELVAVPKRTARRHVRALAHTLKERCVGAALAARNAKEPTAAAAVRP